jgi:hypothetical protein
LPLAQSLQVAVPVAEAYFPTKHGEQRPDPANEYDPMPQLLQVVCPARAVTVPAPHWTHVSAPLAGP